MTRFVAEESQTSHVRVAARGELDVTSDEVRGASPSSPGSYLYKVLGYVLKVTICVVLARKRYCWPHPRTLPWAIV